MAGIQSVVNSVLVPVFDELKAGSPPALRPSPRADFQVDGALALAKALGRAPRDVATEVLEKANANGLAEICERAEVAGPGFINLWVSPGFLADALRSFAASATLGVEAASPKKRVLVDYGGPNAAKEMHVGHLRSSIIGDALVRMLELVGHEVLRENHIGDWGAPFGMLIEHLVDLGEEAAARELAVGDLEAFYQAARRAFEEDPAFAERARARVVMLQSGDPATVELWQALVQRSVSHFDEAFRRLGTKLTTDDVVGESFYNPMLPEVVRDLAEAGLLQESEGALCVFPPGFTNREGEPLPLIVQNSAGGYTYAATDLAAIKDRVRRLGAQLVVYVVGLPQSQHFEMVFATAKMLGWLGQSSEAVHVGFGNVLGPDGKMFRTRQGGTVKLAELLDEAVERARALLVSRGEGGEGPEGSLDIEAVARAVGIGAVKYADLSTDRARDYRFDWDRMLSFDGNTAPYIQYANARVRSVLRKAAEEGTAEAGALAAGAAGALLSVAGWFGPPVGTEERELAKRLLGFPDALEAALATYSPHRICAYLFDLAGGFTDFYENCPVLRAPTEEARRARLALCGLSGAVLERGLSALGIEAPERM
jgi:arginyl-tRNA synthetase